jgi:hypothetical protein
LLPRCARILKLEPTVPGGLPYLGAYPWLPFLLTSDEVAPNARPDAR